MKSLTKRQIRAESKRRAMAWVKRETEWQNELGQVIYLIEKWLRRCQATEHPKPKGNSK